jgi:hypothetical protein
MWENQLSAAKRSIKTANAALATASSLFFGIFVTNSLIRMLGVSTKHPPCESDGKSTAAQQSRDRGQYVHNNFVEPDPHVNTLQTQKSNP